MKLGRNDPCSCGSGKKYKNCCLGKTEFRPHRTSVPTQDEINLLDTMFIAGRYLELESWAHSLLKQYPDSGIVWKLLGLSLQMQGKDALSALHKATELLPNDAEAHGNLAAALRARGQPDAAVAIGRRAVQIRPNFAEAHNNLGVALQELGRIEEAVTSYLCALEIKPDFIEAYNNLGGALKRLGRVDEAVACYRSVLEIKPDFAEAHNNLGISLNDLGQFNAALASYRRALEIKPEYAEAHNNLLFTLNYTAQAPEYCMEEAQKYGRMVSRKVSSRFSAWQYADPPQRLRVGMVSGDLHNHPVGYFLESLLANLDPARIELIAYPTDLRVDALTTRIKPYFSAWKSLYSLSDEAAARLIHADGVHVLLDLSGHTGKSRLPVFAWKPAPVQVTWLGYFATTGVAEMDYILGDKWTLPDGEEHHFVEKGWRLPGALSCLSPPQEDIKVEALPALRNRSITFGTLNNFAKMNDQVVACWARILSEIPDSQLYLNMSSLRDDALKQSVIERYAAQGIPENRLILEPTTGRVAALNSYNRIDIALDPFPYPGGTTSYEALWMGVPILTMRGSNYISHLGESIMHNAGLPEWIAENEADYIARAVAFSADLENLAKLRSSLRARVLASPLFDAPLFARNFEDALWGMWQARTNGNSFAQTQSLASSND
jgi:protein O-GlcNAc transferase